MWNGSCCPFITEDGCKNAIILTEDGNEVLASFSKAELQLSCSVFFFDRTSEETLDWCGDRSLSTVDGDDCSNGLSLLQKRQS